MSSIIKSEISVTTKRVHFQWVDANNKTRTSQIPRESCSHVWITTVARCSECYDDKVVEVKMSVAKIKNDFRQPSEPADNTRICT